MKKDNVIFFIGCVVVIGLCALLTVFIKNSNKDNNKTDNNKPEVVEKDPNLLSGKHYVEISVKGYGKIKLELDADVAPITVTNFINLVNDGFYDGLTFHRIMDNFMIQGGGYDKEGYRKNADNIKGEFALNGVQNNISHKEGVISMARANSYNSASSEFFIMNTDYESLDGSYAAFGHVTSGMDVVQKITKKAKPTDNNGSIKIEERPLIEYIKVIDK